MEAPVQHPPPPTSHSGLTLELVPGGQKGFKGTRYCIQTEPTMLWLCDLELIPQAQNLSLVALQLRSRDLASRVVRIKSRSCKIRSFLR